MAKPKNTVVNFVLDETGSMLSVKVATISGFNEYLVGLKESKAKVWMTLTKFNSTKVEVVHDAVLVKDVPDLNEKTYVPEHLTPLYDAIGKTIRATEEALKKKRGKPAVLCVIMTDGLENASKEYTREGIFNLIEEKTKEGWTFAYLGANQDAYAVGESIGVARGSSLNFAGTPDGVAVATSAMAMATRSYLDSGSQQTADFFEKSDCDASGD